MMKHAIVVLAIVGALLAVPGEAGAISVEYRFVQSFGAGILSNDFGVTSDPLGNIWVADTGPGLGHHRVVEFDGSTGAVLGTWTGSPTFVNPKGIVVSQTSTGANPLTFDVLVSDGNLPTGTQRVEKATYASGVLGSFSAVTTAFTLINPSGLDADSSHNVWIVDNNSPKRLQRLIYNSGTGTYSGDTSTYRSTSPSPTMSSLVDVAADGFGNVWVTDTGGSTHRVWKMTAGSGSPGTWTSFTTANGQAFNTLSGIAVDAQNHVWVVDYKLGTNAYSRIVELDSNGNFLYEYGLGANDYDFITSSNGPGGIEVDVWGNIWVADTAHNLVVELSVIPEPVTMAGLALGLGCLTRYVRRRRTA